jgi:hypothetical protein
MQKSEIPGASSGHFEDIDRHNCLRSWKFSLLVRRAVIEVRATNPMNYNSKPKYRFKFIIVKAERRKESEIVRNFQAVGSGQWTEVDFSGQ